MSRAGIAFVAPVALLFLVVRVVPALAALYLSFTEFSGISTPAWIGLDNFRDLLDDDSFKAALRNTLIYTFGVVVPSTLLGMAVAMLLNTRLMFRSLFRTIFFLPAVISLVSIAMIWAYILNSQFGVLNFLLSELGMKRVAWLDDPRYALGTLILLGIWKNVGYTSVIFLAALQGLPSEIYEAASVDGANRWQQFCRITWPLLLPVTVFVAFMLSIAAFQTFDQVLVLTGGGPAGSTTTVVLETYKAGFQFLKFGYASAMAFALFAIIAVVGSVMLFAKKKLSAR